MSRPSAAVSIALALVLAPGGCSFALVDRAPPGETWPHERTSRENLAACTDRPVIPIVDGAITVGLAGGAVYAATRGVGNGEANAVLAVVALGIAVPYFASAMYGLAATRRCRVYEAGPPYPYPPETGR
jgi:hypothetical protein